MFSFKRFDIDDAGCAMKVGTDSVLLGAWTALRAPGCDGGTLRVLDAGAGSGVLSLMLAQRCEQCGVPCHITAVEIDGRACTDARANIGRSPWADRIETVCGDALAVTAAEAPRLVVSNPPFFANGLLSPDATRALARHGAPDGALTPFSLIEYAARVLADDGTVAMITPADYADRLLYEAEMHRLCLWRRCRVSTVSGKGAARMLWQFARRQYPVEDTALSIRHDGRSVFTPEYRELTADFYLHF